MFGTAKRQNMTREEDSPTIDKIPLLGFSLQVPSVAIMTNPRKYRLALLMNSCASASEETLLQG